LIVWILNWAPFVPDRWDVMGSELLKLKDRQEKDLCLAPVSSTMITITHVKET